MNAIETSRPSFSTMPREGTVEAEDGHRLWRRLTPIQRALLATDGSFTLLIKALSGEDIGVKVLVQGVASVGRSRPELGVSAGDALLQRTVLLQTRHSRQNLVYAESDIAVDRLESPLKDRLLTGLEPIGLLLRASRLETFRELLDWGQCPVPRPARPYFEDAPMVFRRYRISAGARPIMVVSEFFGSSLFEEHSSPMELMSA